MKVHKGNETKFIEECAQIGTHTLRVSSSLSCPHHLTIHTHDSLPPSPSHSQPPNPAHTGVKKGQFTDFSTFPADTLEAMRAGVKDAYTYIFDPANAAKVGWSVRTCPCPSLFGCCMRWVVCACPCSCPCMCVRVCVSIPVLS